MELSVKDRLYIPALLPKEGNFQQFNLKKEIRRKVAISDREREELGLRENPDTKRIEWDVAKEIPLHADFTQEEIDYLKSVCEKLSDEQLPDDMWSSVEAIYNAAQGA